MIWAIALLCGKVAHFGQGRAAKLARSSSPRNQPTVRMFPQRHYWVPSPCTDEPGTFHDSMCQLNEVKPSSPIRRRAALKTVQLPAAEGHQNRYVWKNYTKSQRNARNSLKVFCANEKKQI
jgi:hypothetical protein